MKSRDGKSQKEEKSKREKIRYEKNQKKEDIDTRKGRKVAKPCLSPLICGSTGSKSRLAKAAVRSQLARWKTKNCTPLWREVRFQVKMYKAQQRRTFFRSYNVEKMHAVMARSAFPSQNGKAYFEVKMYKKPHIRATFGRSDVVSRDRHKGL